MKWNELFILLSLMTLFLVNDVLGLADIGWVLYKSVFNIKNLYDLEGSTQDKSDKLECCNRLCFWT